MSLSSPGALGNKGKKCYKGPLHKYVTPKMAVFDSPTHPVTLGHVSLEGLDPHTHPPLA